MLGILLPFSPAATRHVDNALPEALSLATKDTAQRRPSAPPTFGWRGVGAASAGVPVALVWHWLRWFERMGLSAPSASAIFPGARTSPTLNRLSIDSTQPLIQGGQR